MSLWLLLQIRLVTYQNDAWSVLRITAALMMRPDELLLSLELWASSPRNLLTQTIYRTGNSISWAYLKTSPLNTHQSGGVRLLQTRCIIRRNGLWHRQNFPRRCWQKEMDFKEARHTKAKAWGEARKTKAGMVSHSRTRDENTNSGQCSEINNILN